MSRKFKQTNLKTMLNTSLGVFLVTGLTGCDNECDDKNLSFAPQKVIDECKDREKQSYYNSSNRTTSSGYFAPIVCSSTNHLYGG